MTKMTDEELVAVWRDVQIAKVGTRNIYASHLLAHIAALTAERDEVGAEKTKAEGWVGLARGELLARGLPATNREEAMASLRAALSERDTLREQLAKVTAERDEMKRILDDIQATTTPRSFQGELVAATVERLANERDALRERVRALAEQAETKARMLATARQRGDAAESRLAAIRQRAANSAAMADIYEEHDGSIEESCLAVARYITGEDAQPPQTDDLSAVEQWRENVEAKAEKCRCGEPQSRHDATGYRMAWDGGPNWSVICDGFTPAEPTTAEAFATVRMTDERLRNICEQEPGLDADDAEEVLAELKRARDNETLLERRMGAQRRALEETLKLHHRMPGDIVAQIQVALTDAPPVFTLEEVERAARGVAADSKDPHAHNAAIAVWERLESTRRKS